MPVLRVAFCHPDLGLGGEAVIADPNMSCIYKRSGLLQVLSVS